MVRFNLNITEEELHKGNHFNAIYAQACARDNSQVCGFFLLWYDVGEIFEDKCVRTEAEIDRQY